MCEYETSNIRQTFDGKSRTRHVHYNIHNIIMLVYCFLKDSNTQGRLGVLGFILFVPYFFKLLCIYTHKPTFVHRAYIYIFLPHLKRSYVLVL